MRTAAIETTMEIFAYWLERDWPRVVELRPMRLQRDVAAGRYERTWAVSWEALPVGTVYAETTRAGRVYLEFHQVAELQGFEGCNEFEAPLEAWLSWRFNAPSMLESRQEPPKTLPGRPPTSANKWARSQFEAGKVPKDIARQYKDLYEAENAAKRNVTPPAKALGDLYRRWKRMKNTNNSL